MTGTDGRARARTWPPDRRDEPAALGEGYELRHYLAVVWRRKLAVVVTVLLCLGAGLAFAQLRGSTWTSTAQVLAQVTDPDALAGGRTQAGRPGEDATTEMAFITSEQVRGKVEDEVGHSVDVAVGRPNNDSDVVDITVTGGDRAQVEKDAQTWAETYVKVRRDQLDEAADAGVKQLKSEIADVDEKLDKANDPIADIDEQIGQTYDAVVREGLQNQRQELVAARNVLADRHQALTQQLDQLRLAQTMNPTYGVQLLSDAADAESSGPKAWQVGVAAGGIGLLLGLALAFAREHFDDSIRRKQEFEAAAAVPVVGLLPQAHGQRRGPDVRPNARPRPATVEAYRRLRTGLQLATPGGGPRRVLVASPGAREGRTTTAVRLALALAGTGARVVLVDGNLRRPALHRVFGLANDVGLSTVLSGSVPVADATQSPPGHPNLSVLTSGPGVDDPAALLGHPHGREMLDQLHASADHVVVDSPPLLPVTDALVLAGTVDAVLLVARSGRTGARDLAAAVELLGQAGAPMVGGVLNGADTRAEGLRPYADRRRRGASEVASGRRAHPAPLPPTTQDRPAELGS